MLVIKKEKEKDLWLIRSSKRTYRGKRNYRCYIDVCRKEKTLKLYNCSKTVERGVKKIFRMSRIEESGQVTIGLSDEQMLYVDAVLAGARLSTILRHYMVEVERN
jgi:hypothetical protein